MNYDPYTYNPMLRSFFVTGNFSTLPDKAAKVAAERPELSMHINAVWNFLSWMKNSSPELYNIITNQRPELVDPAEVVASGALSPDAATSTLAGMGEVEATATDAPATSWGQEFLNTLKNIAPAYFSFKTQSDLMKTNLRRAELGLDPIDSQTVAPTVNVGVSNDVRTIGYLAVGGLVLVGLLTAFKGRR